MTASHAPVRHSRKGLYGPLLIALLALAAWTGWWFYLTTQIETRIEAQAASLRQQGWTVRHAGLETTGWPFRARVAIAHPDIVAPSGHGLAAPSLIAEANAYNPDRWVMIAPDGLTLTRAGKGAVGVRGDALRLSVSDLTARFPDLRVEMVKPVFTAHRDAEPFPISQAELIALEARPHLTGGEATTDELDVLFRMIDARGRSGGPVEGMTQQGRLTAQIQTTIAGASRLRGMDTAGVFAAWTRAGGRFTHVRGELTAGESKALLSSESLRAGPDGRIEGAIALKADRPLPAIAGLARSGSGGVNRVGAAGAAAASAVGGGRGDVDLTLVFRDGRTFLGPFALAPAPKLF